MNVEIESAVLGGMLSCLENAANAAQRLDRYRFSDDSHQAIFDEIVNQVDVKGSVDITLVKAKTLGRVDDESWFLIEQFEDSTDFNDYVESLYRDGRRKDGKRLLRQAEKRFEEDDDPDAVFDYITANAAGNDSKPAGAKTSHNMKDMVSQFIDTFEERAQSDEVIFGLKSGIDDFDEQTGGLGPGDLVIIAGRPAMGKTTFAMNIMENSLRNGGRGLMFSLEMPAAQITQRMVASAGSINMGRIKNAKLTGLEAARLPQAIKQINAYDFHCEDEGNIPMSKVKRIAIKEHRKQPLTLMIIDYLQLMDFGPDTGNKASQIGDVTGQLKALAKFLGIPIIVLSQLNRSLESRADKRPMNSDLRESGAIEQDADIICFVYRDEVYNPMTEDKDIAEIIIGKQRNGPIGTVKTKFEGEYSRFVGLPKDTSAASTELLF